MFLQENFQNYVTDWRQSESKRCANPTFLLAS
jgi:hypothetical protein